MPRWIKYILPFLITGVVVFHPLWAQEDTEEELIETETQIKSIYFGGGSYYVDDEQLNDLRSFLTELGNINRYVISIHSHTDNIGGAEYNEWLSQMRSESVVFHLVNENVPVNNIHIRDFGQFNPVFDNDSWGGRQRNRRVDIIFEPITF